MVDFFKKIKLIQTFSIPIPMEQIEFVKLCRSKMETKEDSFLSAQLEYFIRKNNKYTGTVEHNGLKIRKRKKIFTLSKNTCEIAAVFRKNEGVLLLETSIKPFSIFKMYCYISLTVLAILYILFNLIKSPEPIFLIFFDFLMLSFFLWVIPLYFLKLRIKAMKIEFNEDIYNWILKM